MVTKKTVAAAVGGIGGTAAVGAGVHQLTKETPINEELKTKLKSVNNKFELNFDCKDCIKALRKETYSKEDYKAAVIACAKKKKFDVIAEALGLTILKEGNKGNAEGNSGGTNNKTTIQAITDTKTTGKENGTNTNTNNQAQTPLVAYCKDNNNNKELNNQITDKQGHDFLTACTRESTAANATTRKGFLNKHFGTDGITIESKIKEAGFGFTDTKSEDCIKKLDEDFDNYGNKYKEAVKSCAKSKTFEERAKELNLFSLQGDQGDNTGNSDGSTIKERIKGATETLLNGKDSTGDAAKSSLIEHCTSKNKNIKDTFSQEDGKKFLNACTKDKASATTLTELLSKDFGTNKTTQASTN